VIYKLHTHNTATEALNYEEARRQVIKLGDVCMILNIFTYPAVKA
jgi:hypothetical protein